MGRSLSGGRFTTVSRDRRSRIARLNEDGTLDASFKPNANEEIDSVAVQADGKILIGGYFSSVAGTARQSLARLTADGTLDLSFGPNVFAGGAFPAVNTTAVQAEGKIVIEGFFTTPISHCPRATVACLARPRKSLLDCSDSPI